FDGLSVRLFRRAYDPLRRRAHDAGERGNGVMPATRLLARRDAVAVACVRDLRQGFHGDQAGLEDLLIRPALPGELAKNRQILLPEFARPRWWCHPRPPYLKSGAVSAPQTRHSARQETGSHPCG